MPVGHLGIPLAVASNVDRWASTLQIVIAIAAVAVSVVVALVVDRILSRSGRDLAEVALRGELTPEADTRLRFVRRLLFACIVAGGIAIALSQFRGVSRVAASLLASGAIAAAVIGFAARQTLANLVAGIMLAITQPLRVGDWVTFDDEYGEVEDVRLNYTVLRTPADQRIVIPNERLVTGVLRNETLMTNHVGLDVALWLPPTADASRAVAVLEEETGSSVAIAEQVPWGTRLGVGGEACAPPERPAREAALRLRCLSRLRDEGLLAEPGDATVGDRTGTGG